MLSLYSPLLKTPFKALIFKPTLSFFKDLCNLQFDLKQIFNNYKSKKKKTTRFLALVVYHTNLKDYFKYFFLYVLKLIKFTFVLELYNFFKGKYKTIMPVI